MNSDTIRENGATDRLNGQARKPWVMPSLQIIALKSAQNGRQIHKLDSIGSRTIRPRS
jgi:hypothetical protein